MNRLSLAALCAALVACSEDPFPFGAFPSDSGTDGSGGGDASSDDGGGGSDAPVEPTACDDDRVCGRGRVCTENTCASAPCDVTDDCGAAERACMFEGAGGVYRATAAGKCTAVECRTSRDCGVGSVCIDSVCYAEAATDACGGLCGANERCEGGDCVATCTPACGPSQRCDGATGACVDVGTGALCAPCTDSSQCGGDDDACLAVDPSSSFCGRACASADDCPPAFVCFDTGSDSGSQCLPAGGRCIGCVVDGCSAGDYCDANDGRCKPFVAVCEACASTAQCGDNAVCDVVGDSSVCLARCTDGRCGGGYACVDGTCFPSGGTCGGDACDRTCTPPLGVLDALRCVCVGCATDDDCASEQVCNSAGACVIASGAECSTTSDCGAGYCSGGVCVECLSSSDCGEGQQCRAGACADCDCPSGQRCDAAGECVVVGDPTRCASDEACVAIANALGYTGDDAKCDPDYGCITAGLCNDAAPGTLPIPGGSTETDPFDAACPPSAPCEANITLDLLGGGTNLLVNACTGCTVGDDSTCRAGETCRAPLLPIFSSTPYCQTGSGGGFPFPFP